MSASTRSTRRVAAAWCSGPSRRPGWRSCSAHASRSGCPTAGPGCRYGVSGGAIEYTTTRRLARSTGDRRARRRTSGSESSRPTPLAVFLTARWGLHTRWAGRTLFIPNEHGPWPLHRATLVHLDDDLVAAAGLPGRHQPRPDSRAVVPRRPDRLRPTAQSSAGYRASGRGCQSGKASEKRARTAAHGGRRRCCPSPRGRRGRRRGRCRRRSAVRRGSTSVRRRSARRS